MKTKHTIPEINKFCELAGFVKLKESEDKKSYVWQKYFEYPYGDVVENYPEEDFMLEFYVDENENTVELEITAPHSDGNTRVLTL